MATDDPANPPSMTVEDTRQIVHAYHDAYCRKDVPAAAALLGERFHFSSPLMTFDNPQQHVAALNRFVPFVTGCDLISELYGEREATLAPANWVKTRMWCWGTHTGPGDYLRELQYTLAARWTSTWPAGHARTA